MRLATWIALGLGIVAMIPVAVEPQKNSTNYELAHLDLAAVYKAKSPEEMKRTIFMFGGSQLAFGLDSAQFADAGFELANLGLNVGVGLAYPMHLIDLIRAELPHSTPPAAIIISPGIPHFKDETLHDESLVEVLSASPDGARWAWSYAGLPLWLQVKARSAQVWVGYLAKRFNPRASRVHLPQRGESHRAIVTQSGTIADSFLATDTVPPQLNIIHNQAHGTPDAPHTVAWLKNQNAPIFVLPPPVVLCDSAAAASANAVYASFTNQCGENARLLTTYPQGTFPASFFIVGPHLNRTGRIAWTQQIVSALRNQISN